MRRRWTYTLGGRPLPEPVEVTEGAEPEGFNATEGRQPLFTDRHYEGLRATDGTDIGSRRKHHEYMNANGLAPADDYTNTWNQAAQKRAEWLQGKAPPTREVREMVGRIACEKRRGR